MYDFFLGAKPTDYEQEMQYLVSVKRLLPRWINSISDSEFVAIATILHNLGKSVEQKGQKLCLVETGVGASTLALAYYAYKHGGQAYTWDFNSKKGSEVRTVCTETIGTLFDSSINSHWKLIGYSSRSPYLGISIVKEWSPVVHFTMHDSEHTWENVKAELELVNPLLADGSVVALDDAYYRFLHTDTAYINITRRKLGLPTIAEIVGNQTDAHAVEAVRFLGQHWQVLDPVDGEYKKQCKDDLSIRFFGNELQVRSELGMEQVKQLESRFAAWAVSGRKA